MLKIRQLLDRIFEVLACAVLLLLLCCVALGVVTRVANDPLIWTDEVARFLMVWLAVLGWVLATRRRGHVRIRFFQDKLPRRLWRAAEAVIQLGMLLLGVLVAGYGAELVERNRELEATTVAVSMAWMYAPLVLAGLVTAGQAIAEIAAQVRPPRDPSPINEELVE